MLDKRDTRHAKKDGRKPEHRGAKASSGVFVWVGAAAVVAAVAVAVFVFGPQEQQEKSPPFERLVEQMTAAAAGAGPPVHAFGGALRVEKTGGGVAVTAEAVPQKVCLNASWVLVNSGTVAINGQIPARISAKALAGHCSSAGEAATVSWTPAKK